MGPVAKGHVEESQGAETHLRRLPQMRSQRDNRVQIARGGGARFGYYFTRLAPEWGTISAFWIFLAVSCGIIVRVMSALSRDNLIKNKARLLTWISEIDRAVQDIAVKGTASATISAAGGSKSYTRLDLDGLRRLRTDYAERVTQINRRLAGAPSTGIRRVMVTRY